MWSALRNDMNEFVSTVTQDTSTVLSTLDNHFPDANEDQDQDQEDDVANTADNDDLDTPHAQEALRRMTLAETFTTPLEVGENESDDDDDEEKAVEAEKKELAEYLESFSIDAKTEEISQLLSDHPGTLKVMFEDIVPATVSYEDFWRAYFYRCDADRIGRQWEEEDERASAARKARMSAGISSVKNFWGGAVQAVSASLKEGDDHVDGAGAGSGTSTSTGQVMEKRGIFGATGRPPFVMNTAVDEDGDDEEEEEELGWDDDDDDLDDLDDDEEESGEVESASEQIVFSDQATEKLQEELRQALEERDQLHETVELQHNVISLLQSEKEASAGAAGGEGSNIEMETLKMELWEKNSELAAMKASQLDTSHVETDSDEKLGSLQEEVDLLTEKLQEKDSELLEMQTLMRNSMEMLQQITTEREQESVALEEALTKTLDIPELESKIQALNDQVTALQSENKELHATLESAQGEGDSKSESVNLEQQLASSEKQVAALTMELESLKASLTSAEKRASVAEEELLSTNEILKNKEESETRLEGELSAAKESLLEKEESEAGLVGELRAAKESLLEKGESETRLEGELSAAKESLLEKEESKVGLEGELRAAKESLHKKEEEEEAVAVLSAASPTDTVSTGVNVESPTLAEKLAGDTDDWGDDWGDDDE
jgi:DNA repair exonuclease SbcCD ATPase subunit